MSDPTWLTQDRINKIKQGEDDAAPSEVLALAGEVRVLRRRAERMDDAIERLDALADLLADSQEIVMGRAPAVRILNEILEALGGKVGSQ